MQPNRQKAWKIKERSCIIGNFNLLRLTVFEWLNWRDLNHLTLMFIKYLRLRHSFVSIPITSLLIIGCIYRVQRHIVFELIILHQKPNTCLNILILIYIKFIILGSYTFCIWLRIPNFYWLFLKTPLINFYCEGNVVQIK